MAAAGWKFRADLQNTGGYAGSTPPIKNVKWKNKWTGGGSFVMPSSPAVADGVVYVGSLDGDVYTLNAASGSINWGFPTGDQVLSSPAVVGGVVYIGSRDKKGLRT